MLGKLIKYEIKSTLRIFLPVYGVIIGFTATRLILDLLNIKLMFSDGLIITTYVLMIIGTLALTFIVGIQRFYKNILGTEGYLMNTLPVKSRQLVASKLITSVGWLFLSIIISLASIMVQLEARGLLKGVWSGFVTLWNSVMLQFSWNSGLVIANIVLMVIVYACYAFLMIYCAMAIGHLFNGNRIIASFVSYIALYFTVQVISVIVLSIYALIFGGGLAFLNNADQTLAFALVNIQLVETVIIGIGYYLATNYIVKKRLNLE